MQRVRPELGVVRADDRDAEQPGHREPADADRPGRRDVDDVGPLLLDAARARRSAAGSAGRATRRSAAAATSRAAARPCPAPPRRATRRRPRRVGPLRRGGGEAPHRPGDAVHLGERVGEEERARLARMDAAAGEELRLDRAEPAARLRVVVGGGEIRELQSGGERERAEPAARAREAPRARRRPRGRARRAGARSARSGRRSRGGAPPRRRRRGRRAARPARRSCPAARRRRCGRRWRRARRRRARASPSSRARRRRIPRRARSRRGTRRPSRRGRRPRRRDVERAVVVGSAGERDAPAVRRLDPVLVGERREERRRHRRREPARELVRLARARAVPSLPDREEEHHPLDVRAVSGGPIR